MICSKRWMGMSLYVLSLLFGFCSGKFVCGSSESECIFPTSDGNSNKLTLEPDVLQITDGNVDAEFECDQLDQKNCKSEQFTWSVNEDIVEDKHAGIEITYNKAICKSFLKITGLTSDCNGAHVVTCTANFINDGNITEHACLRLEIPTQSTAKAGITTTAKASITTTALTSKIPTTRSDRDEVRDSAAANFHKIPAEFIAAVLVTSVFTIMTAISM